MLLSHCISRLHMNGQEVPVDTSVTPGISRVTVTIAEGRFVHLPGDKKAPGRFVFHRLRRDGAYTNEPSKPPGRLTWRRKVKAAWRAP